MWRFVMSVDRTVTPQQWLKWLNFSKKEIIVVIALLILILVWHCALWVCCGPFLSVQRLFSVFCGRLCTWHFHDSCLVWWLAWRLTEPLLRQNQAAFVCMAREHYQTTVHCVHAHVIVPTVQSPAFNAYLCVKHNLARSVLIHCVNPIIYSNS